MSAYTSCPRCNVEAYHHLKPVPATDAPPRGWNSRDIAESETEEIEMKNANGTICVIEHRLTPLTWHAVLNPEVIRECVECRHEWGE